MAHKITKRGTCRLGKVQIEDWTEVYPDLPNMHIVALYAELTANPEHSYLLRGGETARISFDYPTPEEAERAYEHLVAGGDPHDLIDEYHNWEWNMGPNWTSRDTEMYIPH